MADDLLTLCEFNTFTRDAIKLLTAEAIDELLVFLAANPDAGDVIPGTGGVRKFRQPASGRGQRGGARVVYYYLDTDTPLYLIAIYAKNEKGDLSNMEIAQLKKFTTYIKQQRTRQRKTR